MGDLQEIRIFISSPSDVAKCRERARCSVGRMNTLLAKRGGLYLQAMGWEDIPPGRAGRSQEVINPYVDDAHILVGIFGERFGSPTGITDSGTQEEIERIMARWEKENPKPEIWMYFRTLPQARLNQKDSDPQLKRLLEFKDSLSHRGVFYKEFESEDDLGMSIEEAIANWIDDQKYSILKPASGNASTITDIDRKMVALLLDGKKIETEEMERQSGLGHEQFVDSIGRLIAHRLLWRASDGREVSLMRTVEPFTVIVKKMNTPEHAEILLRSPYFRDMLETHLGVIIETRYHVKCGTDLLGALTEMASLSSSTAAFLIYGETVFYDAFAQHTNPQFQQEFGRLPERLLYEALLEFCKDAVNARTLPMTSTGVLAGLKPMVGAVLAWENGRVIEVMTGLKLEVGKAAQTIEMGMPVATDHRGILHRARTMALLKIPEDARFYANSLLEMKDVPEEIKAHARDLLKALGGDGKPQA